MVNGPVSADRAARYGGKARLLSQLARSLYRLLASPTLVLRLLGLILLFAAILKAHELITKPVLETGLLDSRWFQIGWVEFELFFGGWLLSGWYPRATRLAALLLFTVLAAASFAEAVAGESDCGCFGAVQINPWYTFLLDMFVMVLLSTRSFGAASVTVPGKQTQQAEPQRQGLTRVLARFIAIPLCILPVALPAGWAMATYSPRELSDDGEIVGTGDTIVLTPEIWIGKRFPLLSHIDIEARLSKGEWTVLLYRQRCRHCRELLDQIGRSSREYGDELSRCALVEVPPYEEHSTRTASDADGLHYGRLDSGKAWQVETPLAITLADGYVVRVQQGAATVANRFQ